MLTLVAGLPLIPGEVTTLLKPTNGIMRKQSRVLPTTMKAFMVLI